MMETYEKDESDKVLQGIEDELLRKIRLDYAVILLQNTTIIPFRKTPGPGFRCFYCEEMYKTMELLRQHVLNHGIPDKDEINSAMLKAKKKFTFISVNIVDLACRLCNDVVNDDFYELESHLVQNHGIELPEIEGPVLIPYKINKWVKRCAICDKQCRGYNALSFHMNEHYPTFKCEVCGSGFLAVERLLSHMRSHRRRDEEPKSTPGKAAGSSLNKPKIETGVRKWKLSFVKKKPFTIEEAKKMASKGRKLPAKERTNLNIEDNTVAGKRSKTGSGPSRLDKKHMLYVKRHSWVRTAIPLIKNSRILPFKHHSSFRCFYCELHFGFIEDLQKHNDESHGELDEYTIKRVLVSSRGNQVLKVNVTNVDCRLCDDEIVDFKDLKRHLRDNHGFAVNVEDDEMIVPYKITEKGCECAYCGEVTPGFHALSRHINVHFENYVCEECGRGFLSQDRLRAHRISHMQYSFPCPICERAFKSNQAMLSHKRGVHDGTLRSKCPHCHTKFYDFYAKQKHIMEDHNMEVEKYKCQHCEAVYLTKGHLGTHVRAVHLKERNHKCAEEGCGKMYFRKSLLRQHTLSVHQGQTFDCSECSRTYTSMKSLDNHKRIIHRGINYNYECEHCQKRFVLKGNLVGHMKTHELLEDVRNSSLVLIVSEED